MTAPWRCVIPFDANKAVVREFYEQWSSGAIDFERLVHTDIINHQPEREPEIGLEQFRHAINGVMAAVPDSRWKILSLVAEGDLVVCHNIWSGTYRGTAFRGVATPSDRRFSAEHIHIYRLKHNQLAEHWVVRDDLGMLRQLGVTPGSEDASTAGS